MTDPITTGGTGGTNEIPPTGSDSGPEAAPESKNGSHRLRNTLLLSQFAALLAGVVAWNAIWRVPAEVRLFAGLMTVSGYLIVGGLVTLLFIIPAAGSDPEVKTEFYSSRAAYWCVISGVILMGIVVTGVVLAFGLGGGHVLGSK